MPSLGVPPTLAQIKYVRRKLLTWGRSNYQSYPWRSESNPWLSLVAELLLQRTRASQVEPVYLDFAERFPSATQLVSAGPEAAESVTTQLGIHGRGAQLFDLAIAVCENGGVPPEAPELLRMIRGIGPYTTAAWLSFHRNQRAVIIDSNVFRWLGRMTGRPYGRDPRGVRWIQQTADALTPIKKHRVYNYAVLDFTMLICTPKKPKCPECPVSRACAYRNAGFAGPHAINTPGITSRTSEKPHSGDHR